MRLACVFWFSVLSLLAQNSGIQGVVTDPSAAAAPGGTVTITNIATGVVTTAHSNEQGFYSAPLHRGQLQNLSD